jgi:hypothetical protein
MCGARPIVGRRFCLTTRVTNRELNRNFRQDSQDLQDRTKANPFQLFLNLVNPVNHVHSLFLPYLQRRIAEQDPRAAHVAIVGRRFCLTTCVTNRELNRSLDRIYKTYRIGNGRPPISVVSESC